MLSEEERPEGLDTGRLSPIGRECRQAKKLGEDTSDLRVRRAERSVPTASYAGNAADGRPRLQRDIWCHTDSLGRVAERTWERQREAWGICKAAEPRSRGEIPRDFPINLVSEPSRTMNTILLFYRPENSLEHSTIPWKEAVVSGSVPCSP